MNTSFQKSARRGFSLIEVLMYMGIVAVLMLAIFTGYRAVKKSMNANKARAGMQTIVSAVEQYKESNRAYPATLRVLVEGTAGTVTETPLEEADLLDPWDHEYQYELTKGGATPYVLYSWGSGGEGSDKTRIVVKGA